MNLLQETKAEDIEHDQKCFQDRMIFGFCQHDGYGKRIPIDYKTAHETNAKF